MKYLFSIIAFCLCLVACQDDTSSDNSATSNGDVTAPPSMVPGSEGISEQKVVIDELTGEPTIAEKPVNALSTMIGPQPISKIDPITPVVEMPQATTDQVARVIRVLVKDYWVVQTLVRINDALANNQNQGAWFDFKPDGSYDYGFFQKKIGTGAWRFDGQTANLLLDSPLEGDDREWNIKMGKDEDLMIWVGTERFHTNDIQLRLYNFMFIPKNRSEIGLKEKNGVVE